MQRITRENIIENNGQELNVCAVNGCGGGPKYYVYENSIWSQYDDRNVVRRLRSIGIEHEDEIRDRMLWIQRTNPITYAGRIAGLTAGIYMTGNSDNPSANTTILNTASSELIEGESGDSSNIMGFLKHALGHTPDQLETFLLNIKHCRDKIRKSIPWMGHFNVLLGNPEVGKSLVQHQIYGPAYNGLTADCWDVIAKGKVFNKYPIQCCNWVCEDKSLSKYAVNRESLTENIKHIASTFHESIEAKHQDAFTVELNRFGSMSANCNPKAINSLPYIEQKSTKDKINLFLFADTIKLPNKDLKTNGVEYIAEIFRKERKAFHYLVDNYKTPIQLSDNGGRYSVKSFQHHTVMEILEESDPNTMLHGLLCLPSVYDELFHPQALCLVDNKQVLTKYQALLSGIELEVILKNHAREQYDIFKKTADCGLSWSIGDILSKLSDKLGYVDGKEVIKKHRVSMGKKWLIQHTIRDDYKEFASEEEYNEQQSKLMAEDVL